MSKLANGIGWFEIGTDDPAAVERFYGDVFGWTYSSDRDSEAYRFVTTPAENSIKGGIQPTGGKAPNYAIFYVLVEDVAATVRKAEAAGGKVLVPTTKTPDGLVFAHLLDTSGNQFGVFTPAG